MSFRSVRVPSLPIWWNHFNFFPIFAILLCSFSQLWNCSVFIRSHSDSSAAFLTVFRTKYVKTPSMATAKFEIQRSVLNPANQKLIDFVDVLQNLVKDKFGVAAPAIIQQFIFVKKSAHLKNFINQAHLQNGTYDQIVLHLEKRSTTKRFGSSGRNGKNAAVTQEATKPNPVKPRTTGHLCKKPANYQNRCRQLMEEKRQLTPTKNATDSNISKINIGQTNSNHHNNKNASKGNTKNEIKENDRKARTVYALC